MGTPAISGIDTTGRLLVFVREGETVHVPLSGVLTPENLAVSGLAVGAVDKLLTTTANTTVSIPAGWSIDNIFFVSTNANAVTGGIKIGTTSGGTDVVPTVSVPGNSIRDLMQSLDWMPQKRLFSTSAPQTLYIQAVTAWNSASVNIFIQRTKIT